ncbi:MAG TPA: hypothetical protein PLF31_01090 [Candidatus Paceibacterota bacterium]|nr:hypothetical protein [Candidatus Paceibacterota bacterium]
MEENNVGKLEERIAHLEQELGENTRMVRSMYRAQKWGRIYRVIYWIVIIGLALGAFYFIQPYLQAVTSVYETVSGRDSTILEGFSTQLERLQESYQINGSGEAPKTGTGGESL